MGVAVWSAALLTPYPIRIEQQVVPPPAAFPVSKTLHVVVYALLTATIPWLSLGKRRWWLLAFLSFHGAATEFFQQFVPERTASLEDVGINHLGILLGLAGWWFAGALWLVKSPAASLNQRSPSVPAQ
jgi:VanZ family protein